MHILAYGYVPLLWGLKFHANGYANQIPNETMSFVIAHDETGVGSQFIITGRINGEFYRLRAAKTIELIQKSNLYLAMRDSLDIPSKYLLVSELRFDTILYFKLGNENSDTAHKK